LTVTCSLHGLCLPLQLLRSKLNNKRYPKAAYGIVLRQLHEAGVPGAEEAILQRLAAEDTEDEDTYLSKKEKRRYVVGCWHAIQDYIAVCPWYLRLLCILQTKDPTTVSKEASSKQVGLLQSAKESPQLSAGPMQISLLSAWSTPKHCMLGASILCKQLQIVVIQYCSLLQ